MGLWAAAALGIISMKTSAWIRLESSLTLWKAFVKDHRMAVLSTCQPAKTISAHRFPSPSKMAKSSASGACVSQTLNSLKLGTVRTSA